MSEQPSPEKLSLPEVNFSTLPRPLQARILQTAIFSEGCEPPVHVSAPHLRAAAQVAGVCRAWRTLVTTDILGHPALASLAIGYRQTEDAATLAAMLQHLPHLKSVSVIGARASMHPFIRTLASCTALESLSLNFCDKVTGLIDLVFACTTPPRRSCIRELSLNHSFDAVGKGVYLTNLTSLEVLSLEHCRNFSPPRGWLYAFPYLHTLNLKGCGEVNVFELFEDPILERVEAEQAGSSSGGGGAPATLKHLDVSLINGVNNEFLLRLATSRRMSALETLCLGARTNNVWSTGSWTDDGLQRLHEARPTLNIVLGN